MYNQLCLFCGKEAPGNGTHDCVDSQKFLEKLDYFIHINKLKQLVDPLIVEVREVINYDDIEDLDILRERINKLEDALNYTINETWSMEGGNRTDRIQEEVNKILGD